MANEPGTALTAPVQSGVPAVAAPESQVAAIQRTVRVLRPIDTAAVLVAAQQESRTLIAQLLQKDKDYGVVPGVSKPSLLKPGAEKYNAAYGLMARFTVAEKEVDHHISIQWIKRQAQWSGARGQRKKEMVETRGESFGLYRYVINCELIDRATGDVVGSSLGSCSTLESKYVDRPRDLENTVIKMAEKRAYIGATLLTHGLSEQFTQDVEDTGVASDDSSALQPVEPDPGPKEPEVGSAEWAVAYQIPMGVHKALKLAEDQQTFGSLDRVQLDKVIAGMERVAVQNPAKKEDCAVVIKAAERMKDELEERAAIAAETPEQPAAGAPANPTKPAAGASAPTAATPAAGASATTTAPAKAAQQTKGTTGTGDAKLNPLASDGGAVPARDMSGASDLSDEEDDLPF